MSESLVPLCLAQTCVDGGLDAVPFDVVFGGQTCRAFAVRFEGQVHAYLNRCTHVAMEMDYQPNRIFDDTGQWLLCAHPRRRLPARYRCLRRWPLPGRAGEDLALSEADGVVHWHTAYNLTTRRVLT
jgi:hypothetical protein